MAKQNLQVQVYDAMSSLPGLTPQELLQAHDESSINQLLVDQIRSTHKHGSKKLTNPQRLDCIVGGEQCLYKDKDALIEGSVTSLVQLAFQEGKQVVLPGQSEFKPS